MVNKLQIPMFTNNPEWVPPDELPDLSAAKEIAIDVETRDPNLKNKGPGWPTKDGEVIGYAVATSFWSGYLPVKHFGGGNLDEGLIKRWLQKQLTTAEERYTTLEREADETRKRLEAQGAEARVEFDREVEQAMKDAKAKLESARKATAASARDAIEQLDKAIEDLDKKLEKYDQT